jgi:hypothetical protein
LAPLVSKSLYLSTAALDITTGLSDAGYAVGTVLAVQFAVHPARTADAAWLRNGLPGRGNTDHVSWRAWRLDEVQAIDD